MPRKIIIDTDPGIDDSMAIFYALNSPEIELLGLTTIFGNASTEICTTNALRLLEIAGRSDIPVYKGAEKPISSERRGSPGFVHGLDGQGNSNLSPPKISVQNETALEFLHKTIILIEIHDWIKDSDQKINLLIKESQNTHKLKKITTSDRNLSVYRELKNMNDTDRWILCSEGRPRLMSWFRFDPIEK